jgi:aspartate dehydrogenase
MPKRLKIGVVGCGAIGTSLARSIISDFSDSAELSSFYDIDIEKAYKLSSTLKIKKIAALNLDDLINSVGLVIEAATAAASYDIAKKSLLAKKDALVMSTGGIAEHIQELAILAKEKNARLYIPSGAICGLDGLKAAAKSRINKVTLITRKPPSAFKGVAYILKKKINLDQLREDTVLFEGSALSAITHFPANINVAATLSMAGLGLENTVVKIMAVPSATCNIHEVEVESDAGRIFTRTENVIHPDNPKTSYLAVLSALATLREILEPIRVGT